MLILAAVLERWLRLLLSCLATPSASTARMPWFSFFFNVCRTPLAHMHIPLTQIAIAQSRAESIKSAMATNPELTKTALLYTLADIAPSFPKEYPGYPFPVRADNQVLYTILHVHLLPSFQFPSYTGGGRRRANRLGNVAHLLEVRGHTATLACLYPLLNKLAGGKTITLTAFFVLYYIHTCDLRFFPLVNMLSINRDFPPQTTNDINIRLCTSNSKWKIVHYICGYRTTLSCR